MPRTIACRHRSANPRSPLPLDTAERGTRVLPPYAVRRLSRQFGLPTSTASVVALAAGFALEDR